MIELSHVKKKFGKLQVLKDVSLHVEQGEVVVIIGPSGSGKTTFLRCISFLERADAGEIFFGGERADLKKASKKQILSFRRKMAFVFQNYNLFVNKTVLENVMEGLVIAQKVSKQEAEIKALEALSKGTTFHTT